MASYQTGERDPLLDRNIRAMIERRGKELLGAALIGLGLAVALLLASYSPDDPNWLVATDEPTQNLLGRFGATIASPLFVIAGHASWGIALVLAAWGLRFMAHLGDERVLARAIFAPIAIALGAVYASTLLPHSEWTHSFGLGGLFGDTVLGAMLGVVPFAASLGLKFLSVVMFAATLAMAAFVMGFERAEVRAVGRFLTVGLVMIYAWALAALGFAIAQTSRAARLVAERRAMAAAEAETPEACTPEAEARRILTRAEAEAALQGTGPRLLGAQRGARADTDTPRRSLIRSGLGAVPGLLRRAITGEPFRPLEPELVTRPSPAAALDLPAPSPERISARIADAVSARAGFASSRTRTITPRAEPPLRAPVAGSGGGPLDLPDPALSDDLDDLLIDTGDAFDRNAFADLDDDSAGDWDPTPPHAPLATPEPRGVVQTTPRRAAPSRQARAEAQPRLNFTEPEVYAYEAPPLSLLSSAEARHGHQLSHEALEENARMLESVLDDYGVKGEITSIRPGPVVTMYELEPAPGLKASRVIGLADDIARSMSALSARVSTVPGRTVIGIELPNVTREKVVLREILSARAFGDTTMRLPLALGKDISGEPIVANLAKMPHLLIAGTTGSGKSVAINTMILSLLYKLSPKECRLIMIDPKMLELSVYDGIPHLLSPVVTDPKKAVVALKWVVGEMEERYRKMSKMGVRNIEGFNGRVREALAKGAMFKRTVQTGFDDETGDPVFETDEFKPVTIPYIVVVVDEMADLMMVAGKEIEACIQRLAQMARASGIHLIMATQRPSVDVITGTIKANFPTRISFQVTSKIDSRTILGEMGAEQLLGMGDMLYMAGGSRITRIHGPFVSDEEVEEVVTHLKSYGPPEYLSGVVEGPDDGSEADIDLVLGLGGNTDGEDALYDQAVAVVLKDRKVSTSYIQRKLGLGYNKAAKLVEQMEEAGLVSQANHVGKREILVPET